MDTIKCLKRNKNNSYSTNFFNNIFISFKPIDKNMLKFNEDCNPVVLKDKKENEFLIFELSEEERKELKNKFIFQYLLFPVLSILLIYFASLSLFFGNFFILKVEPKFIYYFLVPYGVFIFIEMLTTYAFLFEKKKILKFLSVFLKVFALLIKPFMKRKEFKNNEEIIAGLFFLNTLLFFYTYFFENLVFGLITNIYFGYVLLMFWNYFILHIKEFLDGVKNIKFYRIDIPFRNYYLIETKDEKSSSNKKKENKKSVEKDEQICYHNKKNIKGDESNEGQE